LQVLFSLCSIKDKERKKKRRKNREKENKRRKKGKKHIFSGFLLQE
jgi:hypothetical protein